MPTSPADIPVVILCGGMGSRLRGYGEGPKPMTPIGGRPLIWHLMSIYANHGFRRFVLLLGYRSWDIKEYFLNYRARLADLTLVLGQSPSVRYWGLDGAEDWEVTCVETGVDAQTGARLARAARYLDAGTFLLTYGDGLADIDVSALLAFHRAAGTVGTVTGVHPAGRYGELAVAGDRVRAFVEKPDNSATVNGGFFCFQRSFVEDYLDDDPLLVLEQAPLQRLAGDGGLSVFDHPGFWIGMDTQKDVKTLEDLWATGRAPWMVGGE